MNKIPIEIVENDTSVDFQAKTDGIDIDFKVITNAPIVLPDEHETYDGTCVVTPDMVEQKLLTKDKIMPDDVTVEPIPVYEVSNASGGKTLSIPYEV